MSTANHSYPLCFRFGVLTYSIVGPDAENFKINPTTGDITTAIEFNTEGKPTYYFNVTAKDLGGWQAVVQVQVRILK